MTYGVALRFNSPGELTTAIRTLKSNGYDRLEAYSPFPVDEVIDELVRRPSKIPLLALLGGIIGGVSAYWLEYWTAVIQFPMNVGGRPLHSWPAFIPVTFELTVLFSACAIVVGFFVLNRFPWPHHAMFNLESFARASDDRFFICIRGATVQSVNERTPSLLPALRAEEVQDVQE